MIGIYPISDLVSQVHGIFKSLFSCTYRKDFMHINRTYLDFWSDWSRHVQHVLCPLSGSDSANLDRFRFESIARTAQRQYRVRDSLSRSLPVQWQASRLP